MLEQVEILRTELIVIKMELELYLLKNIMQ